MTNKDSYNPSEIEPKWQKIWDERQLYRVQNKVAGKDNWYALSMLPYPSGDLHVGHWYAFTPADAHARFMRMQGYNVLHPQGFDAFGLPAENAAIRHRAQPRKWTYDNIANMRRQFRLMGNSYDWERTAVTCEPAYYKWNQFFFLKFMENDLAYRKRAPANWCPSCKTTLANEQVRDGDCERCETEVAKRDLPQWFFRITKYADELLDMSQIEWPAKIKLMQRNWLGRSEGVNIKFAVAEQPDLEIVAFTTRADTLFGATFMALAPEHPLVERLTTPERRDAVARYVADARRASEIERSAVNKDKTGAFIGSHCVNPLNGEKLPIFVSDYILMTYGSGAIMGVPAHDERDFAFARQYDINIRAVIAPPDWDGGALAAAYTGAGELVNSAQFNGLSVEAAQKAIAAELQRRRAGEPTVTYRLRDWLISRQRYWGTPIPVLYCQGDCGIVPVPYEDLPVLLPQEAEFLPTGESPLAADAQFLNAKCPRCGGAARRETDTMDTFMDSSWYHIRYLSPNSADAPFLESDARHWTPVDQYMGGAEHAVMHLLYARFFCKALRDLGFLNQDEPYKRLFNQGIMLSQRQKISKRSNPLTPEPLVKKYGADTVRCYLMFIGPWDRGGTWTQTGINGVVRWLKNVWDLALFPSERFGADAGDAQLETELIKLAHSGSRRIVGDMKQFKFNTAIAALMELCNFLSKARARLSDGRTSVGRRAWDDAIERLLLHLAPLAPHIAEELWRRRGAATSIHLARTPVWDDALAVADAAEIPVQVNGRVRGLISIPAGSDQAAVVAIAMSNANVARWLDGKQIKREIYVSDKLLNFVVAN